MWTILYDKKIPKSASVFPKVVYPYCIIRVATLWSRFTSNAETSGKFVVILGCFYGLVLPGQLTGEALKAYYLGKGQENLVFFSFSLVMAMLGFLVHMQMLCKRKKTTNRHSPPSAASYYNNRDR